MLGRVDGRLPMSGSLFAGRVEGSVGRLEGVDGIDGRVDGFKPPDGRLTWGKLGADGRLAG